MALKLKYSSVVELSSINRQYKKTVFLSNHRLKRQFFITNNTRFYLFCKIIFTIFEILNN